MRCHLCLPHARSKNHYSATCNSIPYIAKLLLICAIKVRCWPPWLRRAFAACTYAAIVPPPVPRQRAPLHKSKKSRRCRARMPFSGARPLWPLAKTKAHIAPLFIISRTGSALITCTARKKLPLYAAFLQRRTGDKTNRRRVRASALPRLLPRLLVTRFKP